MTKQPPEEEAPQPEEEQEARLSGTVVRAFQKALDFIGGTSVLIAGLGVAAVVLGGIIYLAFPDLGRSALTTLAVGGVLLLVALTTSFSAVRTAAIGRRGRYSTNAIIMVLAFVSIAALIAFVSFRNSARFDVTATKQFSLAPQTVNILRDLPEPVQATAFFVLGDPAQDAVRPLVDNMLHEFEVRSNNFSYRFVDPDIQRTIALQYGEQFPYQTIFFEAMESGRVTPVVIDPQSPLVEEQRFATALLIVTGVERKQLYFLRGHGEKDIGDAEPGSAGYDLASQGLLADNYGVATLNLLEQVQVPGDTAALIIAGPTKDPTEEEAQAIYDFLKGGGRSILLLDPETPDGWRALLARWAVKVGKDTIVDPILSLSGSPRTVVFLDYVPSEITRPLKETYLPGATAIGLTGEGLPDTLDVAEMAAVMSDPPEELQTIFMQPLGFTTSGSWLTPSQDDNSFQEGRDQGGPFFPAMALQAIAPLGELPSSSPGARETRIVIFGDSDFATNQWFAASSNADLFLNSVNWLTEDINLISVRPKLIPFRQLVVTQRERGFIRYSSWFLLPLAVVLLGGAAWWRRR